MGKAILRLDAHLVAEWFVAGKTKGDAKALLKLPDRYEVNDMAMSDNGQHVAITVSIPELPENTGQVSLPEIEAIFSKNQEEQGQWHVPESYKLVSLKAIVALPVNKET